MRTSFVTSSVSRDAGGLFFAMTRLARSLASSGCEVSAHGVGDSHSVEDAPAWDPVHCHAHPRRGPAAIAWSPELGKALLNGDFDLIHTHGLWQWPSAAVHHWHRKSGQPYIVSPHGMLDPWALALSRWKKRIASIWYESAHLRDAACIHALCQSEADSIRAYGLKNPIAIIPNGVDLPQITDNRQPTTDNGPKVLLFLGRIHPKKGLVNALRAWRSLQTTDNGQRTTDRWQFAIAGWDQGGHEAELKRLCGELGLAWADVPAAEFVGGRSPWSLVLGPWSEALEVGAPHSSSAPQMPRSRLELGASSRSTKDQGSGTKDHMAASVAFLGPAFGDAKDALLRRADAFILPSFSEGLPMAVLEAWAYGLPVLMTEQCNLPEGFAADAAIRIGTGVREQETGDRGQETGDRDQAMGIDEGMRALFDMSDAELLAMGQRGRALVERQFTWPQVAAQMKEVYEWILGGGPRPCSVVL